MISQLHVAYCWQKGRSNWTFVKMSLHVYVKSNGRHIYRSRRVLLVFHCGPYLTTCEQVPVSEVCLSVESGLSWQSARPAAGNCNN